MFHYWFEHHLENVKKLDLESLRPSFMRGGFYKTNIKGITFIQLNSLMWEYRNIKLPQELPQEQMKWLGLVLDWLEVTGEPHVIIDLHIPPGLYFPGKDQTFWNEGYADQFRQIIKWNHKKILIILGAHIHVLDFWYQEEIVAD